MSTTMTKVEEAQGIRAAVRVAEQLCALPAVATQDWCDKAAAALLPIVGAGTCVMLIGRIDERGGIHRCEATGVAGCVSAEITTTVGKAATATSVILHDPNEPLLARARTNLAQARELHWAPGVLSTGQARVGTPASLGAGNAAAQSSLLKRWEAVPHGTILLGAIAISGPERVLAVELAPSPGVQRPVEGELSVLEAALPLLARRAVLAIGHGPSEAANWLTTREQIILQHLLLGKSVREIAEELGRSPHTVHDHVKSLHRTLSASSRGELVARALGYVEAKPGIGEATAVGSDAPG